MIHAKDIKYFQRLQIAQESVKFLHNLDYYEDILQEIAAALLQNTEDDPIIIAKTTAKSVISYERSHTKIFVLKPNKKDGEELDDDQFFVDLSTLPTFGERKSPVTDEMRKKVEEFVTCNDLVYSIYKNGYSKKSKNSILNQIRRYSKSINLKCYGLTLPKLQF